MKSAIVFLSKSDELTFKSLKKSLNLLYINYKYVHESDVLIFVEFDFEESKKYELECSYDNLSIIHIKLQKSSLFLEKLENIKFEEGTEGFQLGYRHMCQFFFSEIFQYLKKYDWFMRLDTDSFIESQINYNLFQHLHSNNKVYGYTAEIPEWEPVVKNLGSYFINYIKSNCYENSFTKKFFDDEKYNLRQIYNNFEIVNLNYYNNHKIIKKITDDINATGEIYIKRWGDAPLRSLILAITTPENMIHKFNDFDYSHAYYTRKNKDEMCSYKGDQLLLFNKWKTEGWLV